MIDQRISKFMCHDVLSGGADTPLHVVVSRMKELRHSVFVVCDRDEPIGLITESDAVNILADALTGTSFRDTLASDIMTHPVETLCEDALMGELISVMKSHGFRRVPIVNPSGQLSGIINLRELQAAMNSTLERRGRELEVAVMARTAELNEAKKKFEALSLSDSLTNLPNRRAMELKFEEVHSLAQRHGTPYAVILCDIDYFKAFNDTLGHLAGDGAIKIVADTLADAIRISDTPFRYGGEEFLVLLPHSDAKSARLVAERIREMLAEHRISHPQSDVSPYVTISLGYTEVADAETALSTPWASVVERADRALYHAKESGRDRAVDFEDI
ncbi:MAG: diguanylate cyclase [Myxococcota bacterium]